jgi:hypothetical protein
MVFCTGARGDRQIGLVKPFADPVGLTHSMLKKQLFSWHEARDAREPANFCPTNPRW